jgi:hypothetical protein
VVIEGFGEEDVGAIGTGRQSKGGEVGGSSGGAEEGARAVMGTDVGEGVLWGWESCGAWDKAREGAVGVSSRVVWFGGWKDG